MIEHYFQQRLPGSYNYLTLYTRGAGEKLSLRYRLRALLNSIISRAEKHERHPGCRALTQADMRLSETYTRLRPIAGKKGGLHFRIELLEDEGRDAEYAKGRADYFAALELKLLPTGEIQLIGLGGKILATQTPINK